MARADRPANPPTDNPIDAEACRWAILLDSRALSEDEQRALDEWLAADTRHLGAFVVARAQWMDMDRVAALAAGTDEVPSELEAVDMRRRLLIAAGIGGIAAAGLGGWVLLNSGERYRTAVGEMRRVALADGSTLILNTDSDVRVEFQPKMRNIVLLRGEAMFEVAHDKTRPFVVSANGVLVRAVGTAFAVRLRDSRVNVTVTEGVVELAQTSASTEIATPQRLAANQQSVVEPAAPPKISRVAPDVVERRFAWINGMVAFNGETLGEAVDEVNRHSPHHVVIDEPSLGRQPIVGVFRATDAEGFSRTAAAALGAVAVKEGDTIHLRRVDIRAGEVAL